MSSTFLMAFALVGTPASEAPSGLASSIKAILECASNRDLACLSKYACGLQHLLVTDERGRKVYYPSLASDAFSDESEISLYKISADRSKFSYKTFKVSPREYEVVFFNRLLFQPIVYADIAGKPNTLQCGFVLVGNEWRLTRSVCGYIDGD